jgi:hypothetical protein
MNSYVLWFIGCYESGHSATRPEYWLYFRAEEVLKMHCHIFNDEITPSIYWQQPYLYKH